MKATSEIIREEALSAGGTRYADDIYLLPLDAVSLTATPASEANSTEGTGIRIDGYDTADDTRATPLLGPTDVWVRGDFTSRHAAADAVKFGNTQAYFVDVYADANNYIRAYWSAANTVTLAFNAQGAGEQTATWDATADWDADVEKLVEIKSNGAQAQLIVAGTVEATIVAACIFTAAFDPSTDVYWGSRQDGTLQYDGVIAAP